MWDVLLDSFLDTLKIIPILYLVYLLVSYLGHNTNNKYAKIMSKTKRYGPLIGGALGCIPQCGFSVVMADLYSQKAITVGTLVAVMLATSDEAIPIMLSNPEHIVDMLILIGIKLVIAVVFGYIFDLTLKLFSKKQEVSENVFEEEHNHDCELTSCSHKHIIHNHQEEQNEHNCKEHKHEGHNCVDNIFLDALMHTLEIAGFLFVATFIIGLIIHYAGMENISKIFTSNKYVQPFIAGLVGLIPSCASSVFLVEFYIAGGISFGAMLAGLCSGSGIALVVLFTKNKKHTLSNIAIMVLLYLIGSVCGLICSLII
mgnify:CR=1 FL=1